MLPENRKKTAKALSLVVFIIGGLAMIGWIFDIGILKSISTSWISMKFNTAVAFLLSSITLYFIVRAQEGEFDKAQVALSISSMIIIILMGVLFFSSIFKVHTGTEELFFEEARGGVKTPFPGQPSMPTMFNFILIALGGILAIINPGKPQPKLKIIGLPIMIIGLVAVFGYAVNAPILYYYIEGVNSAMACNTAISFILLGAGFLCL